VKQNTTASPLHDDDVRAALIDYYGPDYAPLDDIGIRCMASAIRACISSAGRNGRASIRRDVYGYYYFQLLIQRDEAKPF
jgi:hypothetical protein